MLEFLEISESIGLTKVATGTYTKVRQGMYINERLFTHHWLFQVRFQFLSLR